MFKVIVTDAVISPGYNGATALKFSEKGDSVRFRIGKKVYDTRAENNTRWINLSLKAFGYTCERIKKMELKEGSYINLVGRYDEESWEDNGVKKSQIVVIVDEIEYASGGKSKSDKTDENTQPTNATPPAQNNTNVQAQDMPTGFEGFEMPSNGMNFFDSNC